MAINLTKNSLYRKSNVLLAEISTKTNIKEKFLTFSKDQLKFTHYIMSNFRRR